jgi:hypothetical protein
MLRSTLVVQEVAVQILRPLLEALELRAKAITVVIILMAWELRLRLAVVVVLGP